MSEARLKSVRRGISFFFLLVFQFVDGVHWLVQVTLWSEVFPIVGTRKNQRQRVWLNGASAPSDKYLWAGGDGAEAEAGSYWAALSFSSVCLQERRRETKNEERQQKKLCCIINMIIRLSEWDWNAVSVINSKHRCNPKIPCTLLYECDCIQPRDHWWGGAPENPVPPLHCPVLEALYPSS